MSEQTYLHSSKNGCVLEVQLAPRSSRERVLGVHNGRLKISVTAPPVDGKANQALCKFLAKVFKVPASSVQVVRGMTSKEKSVEILGSSEKQLEEVLEIVLMSN